MEGGVFLPRRAARRGPRRDQSSPRGARMDELGPKGRLRWEGGPARPLQALRCARDRARRELERGLRPAAGARGPAARIVQPAACAPPGARRPQPSGRRGLPGRWWPRALTFGAEHEVERAVPCCCHSEARPWAMPGGGGHGRLGGRAAGQTAASGDCAAPRKQRIGGGRDRREPPGAQGRGWARLREGGSADARSPELRAQGGEASLMQWWKRGRRAPWRASPMAAPCA